MKSNEGPFPLQKKVSDAFLEGARIANRYPDSLKHIKRRIGEINFGLGPECVLPVTLKHLLKSCHLLTPFL